ncbi:MAG TPA: SapC family protein [Pseudomonas xinjiangensis]|uniref:SapC family protein n=2 Tax=root TaxID=1 RepID=A0A7V1BRR4_9GAMM|nr:SapC family protein [Halopseudomonas xinjiangensis]HEC47869.1 SapC family protein [Halopseudomonas xinjiangensis]
MSTLLLYKEIKALNRDEHKSLKLKTVGDCRFADATHIVPLAGLEFFQAARGYPIVFIGEGENVSPIALLGLSEGQNSYLQDDGQWRANTYVPAFIRRYPFVLAQGEDANFTVCFDEAYAGWNETEGRELFSESGDNSEYLNEMIGFLQNFTAEMQRTRQFIVVLQELELLAPRTLKLTHGSGESFVLRDFLAVDEEKFLKLDDDQVLSLHKAGFLGWIYAHLMSLGNANQLFEHYLEVKQAAATTH